MANKVLNHLPDYADPTLAKILIPSYTIGNSATHGDALFLRTHYKGRKARPLEFVPDQNDIDADAISVFVIWAWTRIARFFNDEDWFSRHFYQEYKRILKERYDTAPQADAPRILTLDTIIPS